MDGSFKNYLFNNIGLGQNNDVSTPGVNLTAIQNIISFENWYFNNSFHRFVAATRQQAPDAGRFRYLGNVFSDVSQMLFRHANPQDTPPDPNASHYTQGGNFDYSSIAYSGNVLQHISRRIGTFEETGVVYDSLENFSEALAKVNAQASDLGQRTDTPPLRNPDQMDWRPAPESSAPDVDVRVFVPWGLARTVGEWHFRPNRANPNEIMDEHWFMTTRYGDRKTYKDTPRTPLEGKNLSPASFTEGPYDSWIPSALRVDGNTVLRVAHENLAESGISVDVQQSSLIVEAILRPNGDGLIAGKFDGQTGYKLEIKDGAPSFRIATDSGNDLAVTGPRLAPGKWHHLLGELDQANRRLTLHVAGTPGTTVNLTNLTGSLSNKADFVVGEGFAGDIDFLRVALSSLAESKTSYKELHTWQTNGPQYFDFTGRDRRNSNAAGALLP